MKHPFAAMTAFLALSGGLAHAGLVYDNGPINGSVGAWQINAPYSVTDSFTVTQSTNLAWAEAGVWADGTAPESVDWSIGTTPYGDDISSGVSTIADDFTGNYGYGFYPIYEAGFALSGSVASGTTYYLTLTDAVAAGFTYWDENDGPSSAETTGVGTIGSESFQLYDTVQTNVPDRAASVVLLAAGLLCLAGVRRWSPA